MDVLKSMGAGFYTFSEKSKRTRRFCNHTNFLCSNQVISNVFERWSDCRRGRFLPLPALFKCFASNPPNPSTTIIQFTDDLAIITTGQTEDRKKLVGHMTDRISWSVIRPTETSSLPVDWTSVLIARKIIGRSNDWILKILTSDLLQTFWKRSPVKGKKLKKNRNQMYKFMGTNQTCHSLQISVF